MRKVTVTLGVPKRMRKELREQLDPRMQDGFCVYFESDDPGESIAMQSMCLCTLGSAVEAWLTGAPPARILRIVASHNKKR